MPPGCPSGRFAWEHDAHLCWHRSKVDRFLLGDDVSAYDEVARLGNGGAMTRSANSRERSPVRSQWQMGSRDRP